jgi:hypothetical protein
MRLFRPYGSRRKPISDLSKKGTLPSLEKRAITASERWPWKVNLLRHLLSSILWPLLERGYASSTLTVIRRNFVSTSV